MRALNVLAVLALPAAVLAGCKKPDNAPGPGGVSVGEARALDEAAQMIDARQPPPGLTVSSPGTLPLGQASEEPPSGDQADGSQADEGAATPAP